jgi:hypothetical protein
MHFHTQQTVISHMIEGFSFDRGNFRLHHRWTRTLSAGGVCAGLVFLATYCVIQMMNPHFGTGVQSQIVNFKIAFGSLMVGLLSYSLFGLFQAIQADTTTALRLQRVSSWLRDGNAVHAASDTSILLSTCKLSMVRCVEQTNGIQVFLLAFSRSMDKPFLIEAMLLDDSVSAIGSILIDDEEVTASITHVCDYWTPTVAGVMGIELDTPDPLLLDQSDDLPRHGRASSPVQRKRKAAVKSEEVVNAG